MPPARCWLAAQRAGAAAARRLSSRGELVEIRRVRFRIPDIMARFPEHAVRPKSAPRTNPSPNDYDRALTADSKRCSQGAPLRISRVPPDFTARRGRRSSSQRWRHARGLSCFIRPGAAACSSTSPNGETDGASRRVARSRRDRAPISWPSAATSLLGGPQAAILRRQRAGDRPRAAREFRLRERLARRTSFNA